MIDFAEYLRLASDSGAFRDIELEILDATLKTWEERPGKPYTLVEIRDGRLLAGYALFLKANGTDCTYDIHTLAVDLNYRGKNIGRNLLSMIEDEVKKLQPVAIIRAEISKLKEEAIDSGVFESAKFLQIGHIPDFYDKDNDYFIYARYVGPPITSKERGQDKASSPQGGATPQAPG